MRLGRGSKVPLRHRLLLYFPLAFVVLLLLAAGWYFRRPSTIGPDQAWTEVDYASVDEVDLLRRYIRIDTSETTGSELAGARFLGDELEKLGLEPHVETLGARHANIWAILEGEIPEALVLHNHIDVSPADPASWDFDPFGAEIDQAWLYGRGVFDMKSVAIVQLLTLKSLVDRGRKPYRSVVFLATGSEEVGSELGTRWILEQHPELASRFWAVLTEGGVVEPLSRTEIKYWGIEFGQKRFATGFLCAATREELEAAGGLIRIWSRDAQQLRLTPEVAAFGASYGPSRADELYRQALLEPRRHLLDAFAFARLPNYVQSMFRDEVVPFAPEEAPGGGFRMKVVFHLLPGASLEKVVESLLPPWLRHGLSFTVGPVIGGDAVSPLDHPVYEALAEATRALYPEAMVGPYFLPWSATDSRFFRQAGIPSYGFSPFLIFSTDSFRVDGVNERISLPGYLTGFELYRDAVSRIVD